jgi:hypothetical protein
MPEIQMEYWSIGALEYRKKYWRQDVEHHETPTNQMSVEQMSKPKAKVKIQDQETIPFLFVLF